MTTTPSASSETTLVDLTYFNFLEEKHTHDSEFEIIPLALTDHSRSFVSEILTCYLAVDGALDTEVLRSTFWDLIAGRSFPNGLADGSLKLGQPREWRKLGSRLATVPCHDGGDGNCFVCERDMKKDPTHFEYRLPREFSAERPPFAWTTKRYEGTALSNGAIYDRGDGTRVSFHPHSLSLLPFYRSSECPDTLEDMVEMSKDGTVDLPLVHVHVSSFDDMTLIGVSIPHLTMDVPGMGIMLRAWTDLINGRPERVPGRLIGFDYDPLRDFGLRREELTKAKTCLKQNPNMGIITWFQHLVFLCVAIWYWIMQKDEGRMVFIPGEKLRKAQQKAVEELRSEGNKDVFVSDNDIAQAIMAKMQIHHVSRTSRKHHQTGFAVTLRDRIAPLTGCTYPKGVDSSVFIHNATAQVVAPGIPVSEMHKMSLAQIALHNREALLKYEGDAEEWRRQVGVQKELSRRKDIYVPYITSPYFCPVSSWLKAKWDQLDFSGALTEPVSSSSGSSSLGKVKFASGTNEAWKALGPQRVRNFITGRDGVSGDEGSVGGVWIKMGLKTKDWEGMESVVEDLLR